MSAEHTLQIEDRFVSSFPTREEGADILLGSVPTLIFDRNFMEEVPEVALKKVVPLILKKPSRRIDIANILSSKRTDYPIHPHNYITIQERVKREYPNRNKE
jgi:hypothetical protein